MSKNNLGFTMIELLAAIVVLGILMGTAVPIVMSVMTDQKNKTYIDDALRLASTADSKIRSDNSIDIPTRESDSMRGGCIAISLAYMDNNAFAKAPYGGEYDKYASFVVAYRNRSSADEEYTYYVRLIEKTEAGSYRGVNLRNSNLLYNEDARDAYVESLGESVVFALLDYESDTSTLRDMLADSYGVSCSTVLVYGIE